VITIVNYFWSEIVHNFFSAKFRSWFGVNKNTRIIFRIGLTGCCDADLGLLTFSFFAQFFEIAMRRIGAKSGNYLQSGASEARCGALKHRTRALRRF
jgi:hypothetical protein